MAALMPVPGILKIHLKFMYHMAQETKDKDLLSSIIVLTRQ